MEKQTTRKIITLSFVCAAIIAYIVVNVIFRAMAGAFGPVARYYSIDWLNNGLPVAAAFITFVSLQFNKKIVAWAEDVVIEVSKVVWPTGRDTFTMTAVVCFFCGISAVLLMTIDFVAKNLVQFIIQ